MAFLSTIAAAGSGVPFAAALNAAARRGGSFVLVCPGPAGGRAKAVAAALRAATKGSGLVVSSAVVARAAKRSSGGAEDDGPGEADHDASADGGDEEVTDGEDVDAFFLGGSDDTKGTTDRVFVGTGEMTMDELVLMFHKDTAMLLKQVKTFPVGNDETSMASLIATCDAIGEQIHKEAKILHGPEGRRIVRRLIALHLRIVSCAGGAKIRKRGSYLPDMWSGHRHRLPRKEKLAGTTMELLLYSMMLASAALGRYIGAVEWDFTDFD